MVALIPKPRPRRGGFTLIEIAVALAILGLLASTVYLALAGALSAVERTEAAQAPYQRARVARSFLTSALRSTATFSGLPQDGFAAVDSSRGGMARDELTFVAMAPAGSGASRMQLHLYVADSSGGSELRLDVREVAAVDSLLPWRRHVLTRGVAGLEIEFLGSPYQERSVWLERWESRIRLPHAVRVSFIPSEAPDPAYGVPVVAQIPAGSLF
ncbi:MAG: prepilin-type N-terminal cleavage/methylation domain-containing protein [Gemmatimonadota bacterium]